MGEEEKPRSIFRKRWFWVCAGLAVMLLAVGVLRFGNSQWNRWIFVYQGIFCPDSGSNTIGPDPPAGYTGVWMRWWIFNGRKIAEEHYLNGELHGLRISWDDYLGHRTWDRPYKNGKLHGPTVLWHRNGIVSTQGCYQEGKRIGWWLGYYDSGRRKSQMFYHKPGELDGEEISWSETGEVLTVRTWQRDKPWDGLFHDYDGMNRIRKEYRNGKLVSTVNLGVEGFVLAEPDSDGSGRRRQRREDAECRAPKVTMIEWFLSTGVYLFFLCLFFSIGLSFLFCALRHKGDRPLLRWFAVALGLLCVAAGLLPVYFLPGYYRERPIIRQVEDAGADVSLESLCPWLFGPGTPQGMGVPFARARHITFSYPATNADFERVVALLGRLRHLRFLGMYGTKVTGEGLVHLKKLKNLSSINIGGPNIDDSGLVHLRELTNLERIIMRGAAITDHGLRHLVGLNLRILDLEATKLTDAGSAHLEKMEMLEILTLSGTQITDDTLMHLNSKLRVLWLDDTCVTDAGLAHLVRLTGMEYLYLSGTEVTDNGLVYLGSMKKLRVLYLRRTKVTNAGLLHLTMLSDLEGLGVSNTDVTEAGASQLKKALPRVRVVYRE